MSEQRRHLHADLSRKPADWWREMRAADVERARAGGTTAALLTGRAQAVIITAAGARTGLPRTVPVLRVEHQGSFAVVASKGGDSRDPHWCANLRSHPNVTLQDGETTRDYTACEVHGAERDLWWERAAAAHPVYLRYAAAADRTIPVFVLVPTDRTDAPRRAARLTDLDDPPPGE